jgi:hypothetical protein
MDKSMEKFVRDRSGEIFQDDLTENESKARGERRDDAQATLRLDPDIDSQEADRAMAENIFGENEPKKKSDT